MIEKIFTSKKFIIATWCVAGAMLLGATFRLGVLVGYRQAAHSYRFGEMYKKIFGDSHFSDRVPLERDGAFPEAHGAIGQILKIDGENIVVKGLDGVERIVLVSSSSTIMNMRNRVSVSELHPDQYLMILGEADNQGHIIAKFGRVIQSPPAEWNNK